MKHDEFGDRMKSLEKKYTSESIPNDQWMAVRIDGKTFSKFTKGFRKPFDENITMAMVETTKELIKQTHASLGYTQSDEITLLYPPTSGERMFGGKVSKINSVFSSIATAHFNASIKHDKLAYFDCRVWAVESDIEASNVLLWRVQDARKNSISAYFRWTVGHKQMQNLSAKQMLAYINDNGYPGWDQVANFWKYGSYLKPVIKESYMTEEELYKIPQKNRPDLGTKIFRTVVENVDIGYFGDMTLEQRINFIN